MKQTSIFFTTLFWLTILFSCGGGQKDNKTGTVVETPQALQDDKSEIKSFSRSSDDLTEELYQELVDKTPALKKLEEDINAFRPKPNELEETFNKYDRKSNGYYSTANLKATTIKDSLLKQKIINLIANSKNLYANKTKELNSLLEHIYGNTSTLDDHHSALKIVLTLPLIEKYQDNNLPNKKEFKDLIKQQEKLIERNDSLTNNGQKEKY